MDLGIAKSSFLFIQHHQSADELSVAILGFVPKPQPKENKTRVTSYPFSKGDYDK